MPIDVAINVRINRRSDSVMSSELDIGITHAENNTAVRSAGLSSSSNVSADGIVRRDQPESDCFIDINNTISREFNKKAEDVEHSSTHESVEHERWTQAASIQQLWKVTPEEAKGSCRKHWRRPS